MTQGLDRTGRPTVRARSGRRPVPPLIFLLVLAVAALLVWWNVLRTDGGTQNASSATCTGSTAAPPSMDPKKVHLRVLNSTDQQGLAQEVADELKARGFVVDEVGNDSTGRKVSGVGEIRHGPRGTSTAAYVRLYLPGAGDYTDTRATSQVDVVIGPGFDKLATAEEVAAGLSPGAQRSPGC